MLQRIRRLKKRNRISEEEKESLTSAAVDRQLSERFEQGVAKSVSRSAISPIREKNLVQRPTALDPEKFIVHFKTLLTKNPCEVTVTARLVQL